jgi:vacuolar-type H+-ATPase subunit E/Vma4
MSDQQPRKKLSLDRKKLSTTRTSSISSNLKTKLQAKKEDNVQNFFQNTNKELKDLYQQRKTLEEQIKQIEQRLLFAKSEPLQDFLFELKSKDFDLMVKINSYINNI